MFVIRMQSNPTLVQNMRRLRKNIPVLMKAKLFKKAMAVKTKSQDQYVPVSLGILKNSAIVWEPELTDRSLHVDITYGGAASAYALAVHEHPSNMSPPSWMRAAKVEFHPAGHGPKYLERAINEVQGTLMQDLVEEGLRLEELLR